MTDPTSTPQTEPQALEGPKERRRAPISKTREVHARWNNRQQQREVRDYAEAWLQALRAWETKQRSELVSNRSTAGGGGNMRFIVGQYTRGGSSIAALTFSEVHTPLGWVSEVAVARLCGADPLLERLRCGGGLATLCQSGGGWHQHRQQAQAYALAVLGMAQELGDERAKTALEALKLLD